LTNDKGVWLALSTLIFKNIKRKKMSRTIVHWTIKITWEDDTVEYLDDIPNWLANEVEPYLDELENQHE